MTEQGAMMLVQGGLHGGMLGRRMRRRTAMGAIVGILGLAGCSIPGEEHNGTEWSQLLVDALGPLDHVADLYEFKYTMVPTLGLYTAWISGTVYTDTDDACANQTLLAEVGKIIATVHSNNRVKRSWVKVYVQSPSFERYEFEMRSRNDIVTLAEFYGVRR